ncbi:MAG: reverse transcriptase domain-containing protein, partial [Bacteroidales bacterium]|nr:reverse transcriptase domain-containing protein [Bacteroidales bacterium]
MSVTGLYKRLCDVQFLKNSWQIVKAKGSAGGLDKVSVEMFNADVTSELENLKNELLNGTYIPIPYKKVSILKSNNEYRHLGLLSVRDKIIQQAIYNLLYPIVDKKLNNACYAYRHQKGAVKAINRAKHLVDYGKFSFIVSCDLRKYFDNIDHLLLFEMLGKIIDDKKFIELVKLCTKMGRVKRGNRWEDVDLGIPQGSVIAPVLANFYLTLLDEVMINNKYGYVRYADDFIILTKSYDEAKKAIAVAEDIIYNKLKLQIKEKAEIITLEQGFTF